MARVTPANSSEHRLDTEETRFLGYQEVYRDTSVPMPPQAGAGGAPKTTNTARATKTMGARRNVYGRSGHSKQGLNNISKSRSSQ